MRVPRLGVGGWMLAGLGSLVLVLVTVVLLLDWNRLRRPLERLASARSGREVRIAGALEVHPWSWTPAVTVNGLSIGNPPWERGDPLLRIEKLQARIELLPLLRGQVILPQLELLHPQLYLHQDKGGRANWTFENQKPSDAPAPAPLKLPVMRDLRIEDGSLTLVDDLRRLRAKGTIGAREQSAQAKERSFRVTGKGTINNEPFVLEAAGAPLVDLSPQRPYPFELAITAGANHVKAIGSVLKPFDLGGLDLDFDAAGNDLAELYYLTRIALPNTPPYMVRAHVARRGQQVAVTAIAGKLGETDLEGQLAVDTSRKRPVLSGDLISQHLRYDDVLAIFGGRAHTAGSIEPKVAVAPVATIKASAPILRLFPDAPLQVERVRAMDADVRIRAKQIEAGSVPFTAAALHVLLHEGVLSLDPFRFDMAQGQIAGSVRIDARQAVPVVRIDARARDLELQQLKASKATGPAPLSGQLQARAVLEGTGDSVHRVLAGSKGRLTVIVPHGEVRAAFAELAGIDVAEGIGLLVKGNDMSEVRCGVAQFEIEDGTMRADKIVFDTKNVLITGRGDARLGTEELELSIKGDPKKQRLVRLRTPIEVRGHFLKPAIGIDAGHALKQGAVAAAVAVVATPLAAILAFVDPGLAKDQNCAALLSEAEEKTQLPPPTSKR